MKISFDIIKRSTVVKYLIIIGACFVYYGNTIQNEYTFDDFVVITHNKFTKEGIKGIPDIFKYDTFTGCAGTEVNFVKGGRYRPLSLATLAVEYEFFGDNPHINHLTNILYFALTVILLYIFLSKLFSNSNFKNVFPNFSLLAVVLFIAHPVHTEVIANIKGRDEIMSLAGSLAASIFVFKYADTYKLKYLAYAFVLFLFAIFSKENAVTFLAVIPLSIYFYKKENLKNYLIIIASLLLATITYFIIRHFVLCDVKPVPDDFISNPYIGTTFFEKYATIFYTLGLYLKLLIFPHPLTIDYYAYHIKIVNWDNLFALLSLAIYIAIFIYSAVNIRRKSVVAFGILFYLVTVSIVSNILFPIGSTFMGERFIFMPSVGFIIILAWFLAIKIPGKARLKSLQIIFPAIVLVLFFIKTFERNKVWKDDFTLYTTDVKTSPDGRKCNMQASIVLLEKANRISDSVLIKSYRRDALKYAKKTVSIIPGYDEAIDQLGNAYAENNLPDSAIQCFNKIISLKPGLKEIMTGKLTM